MKHHVGLVFDDSANTLYSHLFVPISRKETTRSYLLVPLTSSIICLNETLPQLKYFQADICITASKCKEIILQQSQTPLKICEMAAELKQNGEDNTLQSIRYSRGRLQLLDQRKLPHDSVYIDIQDSTAGWHAIRDMVVRGAPAIAISAALSLAVEVANLGPVDWSVNEAISFLQKRLEFLVSSRPTAVNLSDAATKLNDVVLKAANAMSKPEAIFQAYIEAAEVMLMADINDNKAIGSNGAKFILCQNQKRQNLHVLTHCNTGSLATAGYGTALGVIRALHSEGLLETAFCTETRPYNQGSRLTAYELIHEHIPAVLVADSAAAALQKSGRVDAIVVGADRIAENGDTANKIGTYNLAISAFHHGVPFYVAAPLTSVDLSLSSGEQIIIEERSPKELTHALGGQGQQIAPSGISVWNPAFDVTPANLITAIITEKGVITKKDSSSTFDIKGFVETFTVPLTTETNI